MSRILCFGELLMRLTPGTDAGWLHQQSLPAFIGGAELNTATALAVWGLPVSYCTVLPDHYLTKGIIDSLNEKDIDTAKIKLQGKRMGIYYLPQAADLKAADAIYDREYSSFWQLKPGELDWDFLFDGVSWFHISAISPALNENLAAVCEEAVRIAFRKNIRISIDLNYRSKLWQYGKSPADIIPSLVEYCDLVMGNLWAEEKMLGIPVNQLPGTKEAYLAESHRISSIIAKRFASCQQVANTFRFENAGAVTYYATLYKNTELFVSPSFSTNHALDKVGSGDTFMAGLIYGNYTGLSAQTTIDFSAAAAVDKLFIKGDATTSGIEQIKQRTCQIQSE